MSDLTAIYYTSQGEKPEFEAKIQKALLSALGDIPLITVSQKPLRLGDSNICIGEVGLSGRNAVLQFIRGAAEARTRWVCACEAVTIYPPEYFRFAPPRDDTFYLVEPTWIAFVGERWNKCYGLKTRGFEGAMVCSRDILLRAAIDCLVRAPRGRRFTHWGREKRFSVPTPVLTFKTSQAMNHNIDHSRESYTETLEPFGDIKGLMERYVCG